MSDSDNVSVSGNAPHLTDNTRMMRMERPKRFERGSNVGWILLTGLIVLVAAAKPILSDTLDPDAFWHLRVAEQLRAEGIGPLVDRLSFASMQRPWTPYSWLAELGMDAIWRIGKWQAAIAVQSALQAAFVIFIALACRAGLQNAEPDADRPERSFTHALASPGPLECVIATAIAAFLSLAYLSFRPVTAALALLAMMAWLIVRDRRAGERTRAVWLLIPLTALLVNLHLYAVLVPMWLSALFIGAVLERRTAAPEDRREAERRVSRYSWLLTGTLLACLATPMLPGMVLAAIHYQYGDPMVASGWISEMQPFYRGVAGHIAAGLVLLMVGAALIARRQVRIGDGLWLALSAALLLQFGRFAPVFAIIAAPLFAATMPELSGRILAKPAICALIAMVLALGVVRLAIQFPRHSAKLDTWLNRHGAAAPGYPCAAADFIASNVKPSTGRLINEFSWGGYLEWRLGDRYQTLADGRTQVFSPAFWHATYLDGEDRRASYLSRLRADAAVLPIKRSLFQDALLKQGWHIAYRDDRAQVLLPPADLASEPVRQWPFAQVLLED